MLRSPQAFFCASFVLLLTLELHESGISRAQARVQMKAPGQLAQHAVRAR